MKFGSSTKCECMNCDCGKEQSTIGECFESCGGKCEGCDCEV